jgi:mRNA interferase RelE/StbE
MLDMPAHERMAYEVELTRRADRDVRKIAERAVQSRVVERISLLVDDPRPPDAKRLRGPGGIWRIRVGDWRICYQIRDRLLLVLVLIVGRRGNVYERLTRRLD